MVEVFLLNRFPGQHGACMELPARVPADHVRHALPGGGPDADGHRGPRGRAAGGEQLGARALPAQLSGPSPCQHHRGASLIYHRLPAGSIQGQYVCNGQPARSIR